MKTRAAFIDGLFWFSRGPTLQIWTQLQVQNILELPTVPHTSSFTSDFCTDWHLILNSFSIAGRLHVFTKFWQGVHKFPFLEHCARWLVQGLAWMSARKWHLKIWGNASCYPRSVLRWWFCGAPSKKRFRNLSPIAKHISLLVSNTLFEGDIYLLGSIANVALIQRWTGWYFGGKWLMLHWIETRQDCKMVSWNANP